MNKTESANPDMNRSWVFIQNVILKTILLFVVLNLIFSLLDGEAKIGRISCYNSLIPGRVRFPFGENPAESYNLSLYNIEAMFASHIVSSNDGGNKGELRVFIVGDSSVWGTLLHPDDTLSGQLNKMKLIDRSGKNIRFYNLGYPSLSLAKDLLFLSESQKYQPDLILWLVTLEAFPKDVQFTTPIVENNYEKVKKLSLQNNISIPPDTTNFGKKLWNKTIVGKRRAIADLLRLQLNGILWGATNIDQYYPDTYEAAQRDLTEEIKYHEIDINENVYDNFAFDILCTGMENQDIPIILINEPILISSGRNSDLRYNFYYPRWIYNEYRKLLFDLSYQKNWRYFDYWDIVPEDQFTNTAIHMTPHGTSIFAQYIKEDVLNNILP